MIWLGLALLQRRTHPLPRPSGPLTGYFFQVRYVRPGVPKALIFLVTAGDKPVVFSKRSSDLPVTIKFNGKSYNCRVSPQAAPTDADDVVILKAGESRKLILPLVVPSGLHGRGDMYVNLVGNHAPVGRNGVLPIRPPMAFGPFKLQLHT